MLLVALTLAAPVVAQQVGMQQKVEAELAKAPAGTRFGLVVTDESGRELVAINPDQRFIPASNTKIVTTAAAFATLSAMDAPDAAGGASVRIDGRDVTLTGRGDARLSSAPDCVTNCLTTLAEAVKQRTRHVRHVTGESGLFPDERWPQGMSWNNIPTRSGTAIAALTLDDNELAIEVMQGETGKPPAIKQLGYVEIDNRAVTVAAGSRTSLNVDRLPFERRILLTGTIAADACAQTLRMGIDDPAHYAAWRFATLLRERGVKVRGTIAARYDEGGSGETVATLTPPPLADDIRTINKVSQNLHAELLLRRVGRVNGDGSSAAGLKVVETMFGNAGVPRTAWDFSDGSGMSTYNRVTPRAMVSLLRWASGQGWYAAFRDSLPVGGVDGTLARRFKGTSLEGRIFAKTGSLNASSALAGYMTAKSGRTLTFAAYANDVPGGGGATAQIDAALVAIAEAN